MKYIKGVCNSCGCERLIVHKSKNLCYFCTKKAEVKRRIEKHRKRVDEGLEIDPLKLSLFYQSYWNRHSDRYCVECGIELRRYHKWHIHHLIPKKNWRLYADDIVFADSNCVYVCLQCHSQAETDVQKTKEIKRLTEMALQQFRSSKDVVSIPPNDGRSDDIGS